jgi:predicted  nucleic acid-binding Zn-ribbon protein
MQETIRKLLVLQKHDLEILDLDRRERELQERLATEQREFDEQIAELEAERDRLMHLQVALKELELELESRQEKQRQLESQQAAIKRNVEYKAMMKEILDVQAAIRLTEDKVLEKYEEIEQEKQQTAVRDKQVAERRAKLQERAAAFEGELQRIAQQAEEARRHKAEAEGRLDERALRLYRRIFQNKKGPVVVPIVNRSCGGCHLAVTPQMENATRRLEQIVQCENCARIFYIPDEAPAPAKAPGLSEAPLSAEGTPTTDAGSRESETAPGEGADEAAS